MKTAYVFPGQGAQFPGMGKDLYESSAKAAEMFEQANGILGFRITDIMFEGTEEELKQTKVTQPAIFIHSVVMAKMMEDFHPDMVAGHSLGEFSALTAVDALSFEDALKLVSQRAMAMQKACELQPSTMAAVIGGSTEVVEEACAAVEGEIVVPANFNSPGQIAISGTVRGVELASAALKEKVKLVTPLKVGGAFHSPLMEPARLELAEAINATEFKPPLCPIYQNVDAQPHTDPFEIKCNLIAQLTSPVCWTQSVQRMITDGAEEFIEVGPGKVLTGLIKRIKKAML
ncbi:MAG: ACP S-malonyltransferase [Bacteroidales bacterium]|nr:ACP S-malonyltransferase [Bacteroidales bacterium]